MFQRIAHTAAHDAEHFGVAEFALGLALELRFRHFHRNDRREALHKVFARDGKGDFFEKAVVVAVLFEFTGEGAAESADVGAAVAGTDVVDESHHVFGVRGIVHQGHFYVHVFFAGGDVNGLVDEVGFGFVEIDDKFLQAAFGVKQFGFEAAIVILFRARPRVRGGGPCSGTTVRAGGAPECRTCTRRSQKSLGRAGS
jgi:hypothetical protein